MATLQSIAATFGAGHHLFLLPHPGRCRSTSGDNERILYQKVLAQRGHTEYPQSVEQLTSVPSEPDSATGHQVLPGEFENNGLNAKRLRFACCQTAPDCVNIPYRGIQ